MHNLGYYNGIIKPLENLSIPVTDRAIYFGDGVYEVVYAINQKPFALDDHMSRFFSSCKLLQINFQKSANELKEIILDLLNQEKSYKQKIYWQVSRGSAIRQHTFDNNIKSNLLITITSEEVKNMEKIKYDLILLEDTRFLHCNIKTLNLIPSVLASQKAKDLNADEAVLHRNGMITECAHSNISILKDGKLQTAPANNLILPGITRLHLLDICKKLNIPIIEEPFSVQQLYDCDEAIVSASGALFVGAKSLEGSPIGGKDPTTLRQIQQCYKDKIEKECGTSLY